VRLRVPFRRERKSIDDWPWSSAPPPAWLLGGGGIQMETAVGLPALLGALRLISGAGASCPLKVYRGEAAERVEARDAWQWRLLHRKPQEGTVSSSWRADILGSLAATGRFALRKIRVTDYEQPNGSRIAELIVLDPRKVKPVRKAGQLVYEDQTSGIMRVRPAEDIIYGRTFALPGELEGVSPIEAARQALSAGLKRSRFETAYYDNDARPGIALQFPDEVDEEQAKRFLRLWNAEHAGIDNTHKPAVVGGGAQIKEFPINLRDAQFVDAMMMTVHDVAGIYQIPLSFVTPKEVPTEVDRIFLVTFCFGPLFQIVDEALSYDDELFPAADDLYVAHYTDALLRMDIKGRYEAYKTARQGGWKAPNEIRAEENLPPKDGGDDIQITPVGGAPNQNDGGGSAAGGQQ
jgi:HK97 family phage portal protein